MQIIYNFLEKIYGIFSACQLSTLLLVCLKQSLLQLLLLYLSQNTTNDPRTKMKIVSDYKSFERKSIYTKEQTNQPTKQLEVKSYTFFFPNEFFNILPLQDFCFHWNSIVFVWTVCSFFSDPLSSQHRLTQIMYLDNFILNVIYVCGVLFRSYCRQLQFLLFFSVKMPRVEIVHFV